jgi:transposase
MFTSKETYDFHPLAQSFRMMNENESELLCEDMKSHGQRETIKLVKEDGKDFILDGRNRYKAGRKLKVDCQYEYVTDGTNLKEYVESLNAHRRHLSKVERDEAIIALREQGESIPTIAKKTQQSVGKVHATIKKEEKKRGKALTSRVKAGKDKAGKPKTQKATNVLKPKPPSVKMTDATQITKFTLDFGDGPIEGQIKSLWNSQELANMVRKGRIEVGLRDVKDTEKGWYMMKNLEA